MRVWGSGLEDAIDDGGHHCTCDRGDHEQPELAHGLTAHEQGRAEAAGGIDRHAGNVDADGVDHHQAGAIGSRTACPNDEIGQAGGKVANPLPFDCPRGGEGLGESC